MDAGNLSGTALRCERLRSPLGVQNRHPVFSWIPVSAARAETQTAYRVRVATSPGLVAAGDADLWDSGRVGSGDVTGIEYRGRELSSRLRCWWSVQLWDRAGASGPVSEPAEFELGLLDADDWTADWIGDRDPGTIPFLRREFEVPGDVLRARAYVSGLGFSELRLNGAKVGDRVLDPPATTYDHVPELRSSNGEEVRIHSPRVPYTAFDITGRVRRGSNAVGLILGNGWYAAGPDDTEYFAWSDRPHGLVQLEIESDDGRRIVVVSDGSWRVGAGPIVSSSMVHGEHYDARHEPAGWDEAGFRDDGWTPATILPGPAGARTSAMIEPVRVTETLAPVAVTTARDGIRVVDFGQHVSGWTRIRVTGPVGGRVTLRHAGDVHESGELDDCANILDGDGARQTDVYVGAGGAAEWEPRFTLHGFRYVEVTTTPGVELTGIDARVVHSDVATTGDFACSDDLLTRIDRNVRWTYRASLQGYPQDAADRSERIGWLGDPGWVIEDYLYEFDTVAFWLKWLDDIRDTQLPDGSLPAFAPLQGAGSYLGWPDWATTYPAIAWELYRFSGDRTILERHANGMRRMLDWYSSLAVDGVVEAGLGDHMEPQPDGTCHTTSLRTPIGLTSTAWWFRTADIMASTAEVLGRPDAVELRALAESVRASFTRVFFDPDTATYRRKDETARPLPLWFGTFDPGTQIFAGGSQTALALPLWFGLVPPEHREQVAGNLVAQITDRDRCRRTTGTMGTAALEQVLADIGAADLMYDLATQTEYPSWGDQIRQGATTIWEGWGRAWTVIEQDGSLRARPTSRSMKLLAAISKFLYRDVAGLSPAAPGWARMLVRPALTHRLAEARARLATARGVASIAWRRDADRLDVELTVPSTTVAEVQLPTGWLADPQLREADDVVWAAGRTSDSVSGVSALRRDGEDLRFEVGGGTYRFSITGAPAADA